MNTFRRVHIKKIGQRFSSGNKLQKMLEDGKVQEKLVTSANKYVALIKYPIVGFSGIGFVVSSAFALDVKDSRKLSRTEVLLYPISGTIAGATFGATWPFWLVGAPIVYFLGYDTASSIFKAILMYGLLSGNENKGN